MARQSTASQAVHQIGLNGGGWTEHGIVTSMSEQYRKPTDNTWQRTANDAGTPRAEPSRASASCRPMYW